MEATKENPSYYSILPADVRYCKKLGGNEKVLYSEITALCNKEGYCWATNSYFAKLYGKDTDTISRWVGSLVKLGFIRFELGLGNSRKIYITNLSRPIPKNTDRSPQKYSDPIPKNTANNTIVNTKENTIAGTSPASASKERENSPIIDFKEEMERLQGSPRRDLQVVGLYMEFRKVTLQKTIHNKAQLSLFIKRHLKSANQIVKAEYTDDQIVEFFEETNKKMKDIDWTIESVIKVITK